MKTDQERINDMKALAARMMDVAEGADHDTILGAAAGAFAGFAQALDVPFSQATGMLRACWTKDLDSQPPERALLAAAALQGLISRDAFRADTQVRDLRLAIAEEAVLYADTVIVELARRGA